MYNLFIEGETIGKKAPKKVALEMKNLRTDGEKYFSSKEYLHATQIKSLFSSYVKLKKDGKLTPPTNKTVSIDDEIQNDKFDFKFLLWYLFQFNALLIKQNLKLLKDFKI